MKRVLVLVVTSLLLALGSCDERDPAVPTEPLPVPSDEPTKVRPDPSEIIQG